MTDKVPAPVEKDSLPELAPGEPPLSQALKDKLFERAYEQFYAKMDKITDTKSQVYFTLLASLGTESTNIVSQSANYLVDCEQNRDSDEKLITRKSVATIL